MTHLDWATVDEKAIELLKRLASTVRLAEGDVGDASALRVGAIDKLDPFGRAN